MTEQGYPPRQPDNPGRSGRSRTSQEPRKTGWQVLDSFDDASDAESNLPPWAVPGGIEPLRPARRPPRSARSARVPERPRYGEAAEFDQSGEFVDESGELDESGEFGRPGEFGGPDQGRPGRPGRKPRRSRVAAARRRRSKRRLVTWGGTAIVIAALVAGGILLTRSPAPKSRFVMTLQKGELLSVPDACKVIGAADLRRLLHGAPRSIQPYKGQAQSQCIYTVDAQPTFRVLNILVQAYRASLTVSGNGSATTNAKYNFWQQRSLLITPPKHTPQPPATVTAVGGLGSQALSAVQVFRTDSVTDLVTVLVRYRNVLITASLQGQTSGGFGPVTISELRSGALAVARTVFARVKTEPAVG